jgi:hypothetical protein
MIKILDSCFVNPVFTLSMRKKRLEISGVIINTIGVPFVFMLFFLFMDFGWSIDMGNEIINAPWWLWLLSIVGTLVVIRWQDFSLAHLPIISNRPWIVGDFLTERPLRKTRFFRYKKAYVWGDENNKWYSIL